jgi:hypothetical protein
MFVVYKNLSPTKFSYGSAAFAIIWISSRWDCDKMWRQLEGDDDALLGMWHAQRLVCYCFAHITSAHGGDDPVDRLFHYQGLVKATASSQRLTIHCHKRLLDKRDSLTLIATTTIEEKKNSLLLAKNGRRGHHSPIVCVCVTTSLCEQQ